MQDTGIGIPEELLPKIFDPYFTTKGDAGEGNGLGLSIAYAVVRKNDGHIYAESVSGKGITFHVYLTSVEMEGSEMIDESNLGVRATLPGHILIVDDQQKNLDMFAEMLHVVGCSCVTAAGVQEAYEKYQETFADNVAFDLVIKDMTTSGGMGGLELVKLLRAYDPNVKIIVISVYSDEIAQIKGIPLLPKSFNIMSLRNTLVSTIQ